MKAQILSNITKSRALQCAIVLSVLLAVRPGTISRASVSVCNTPKDSFLTAKVNSVNDLVYEMNSNNKIRTRYANLYHVPSSEVGSYFKQNLKIVNLPHKYYTSIYCVNSSGSIYVRHRSLKPGEKVFALNDGRPVLRWKCGNPLTSKLPVVKTAKYAQAIKPKHKRALVPVVVAENAPLPDTVTPIEKVAPYTESLAAPAESAPSVFSGPTDFNIPVSTTLGPSLAPLLAAIPLIFHGSSGSSSSTPAVVPETSTNVAWMLGGLVLFGAATAGRRKKLTAEKS